MRNFMSFTTPTTRSYNMRLRDYYSGNRDAAKKSLRASKKNTELIKADSDAVRNVSKALRIMEYTTKTGNDIYCNVKSFIDTYNNLMTTTSNSDEYNISHPKKLLQKLTKNEKEALSDIGITLESAGTLKLDEKKFLETTPTKIASKFSENSEFTQKVNFYAGKIYKAARHIDTQV